MISTLYTLPESSVAGRQMHAEGGAKAEQVEVQQYAYLNRPIPIGFDKTISQPLMVAVMTDLLELKPEDMVLEIGTGLVLASCSSVSGWIFSTQC
jgi:protein-L-isoaspartate(D-aspartate) O-methyltransferase